MTTSTEKTVAERFVSIEGREDRGVLSAQLWRALSERYTEVLWRGVPIDKGPFQLATYPILLFQERIETVIEIGSGQGGSAIWLADHLRLFGRSGSVISIDLDLAQVAPTAKEHPGVRFLSGDGEQLAEVLPPSLLRELPHPWLILEDAHISVSAVLDYFHQHGLAKGDYVIIEDTNQEYLAAWSDWPDRPYIDRMAAKLPALRQWLSLHNDDYRIDTFYVDLFGYNTSKCWNSILRRV
jgi:cephalosporin hydroxylase